MFKIPDTLPSKTAPVEELADFIECECIRRGVISIRETIKPIILVSDEINRPGIEDETDILINKTDDVLAELEMRDQACGRNYPFLLTNKGYSLKVNKKDVFYWIYSYLLFSTRLDMIKYKFLEGIDGTELLERLSSIVARKYFGERSESLVFGTADEEITVFAEKVNNLCRRMGEGHSFLNRNFTAPRANDDKLDVAVWKNFMDGKRSKIIGFGQCKTGTSWDDKEAIELQPNIFCEKWMRDTPISPPVKMFFTSQYFPINSYSKAKNAGVVFDRFRIIDFLPRPAKIEPSLLLDIKKWTTKATSIKY